MKSYFYLHTLLSLILLLIFFYLMSIWLLPIIISYFIFLFWYYKKRVLYIFLIFFISILASGNFKTVNSNYNHEAKVVETYKNSLVVKEDGSKYYLMKVPDVFVEGDIIKYQCNYKNKIEKGSFDIFYKGTKSTGYGYPKNIKIISKSTSYRSELKRELIESDGVYSNYVLSMIYKTHTQGNDSLFNTINKMGLSHLFVISGLHISIFYILTNKLVSKITKNKKMSFYSSIFVVSLFLYLTFLPMTGIRALLTIIIINTGRFNRIDSLSIAGIVFFVLNPWIMLGNSMILSFSITYMIYMLNTNKNSFLDLLLISIGAYFVALPTLSTWTTNHNLLAPLLSIALTPIISISYIVGLVILPFKWLWPLGSIFFTILNKIILLFSNFEFIITLNIINALTQVVLLSSTMIMIHVFRNNRIILLNTFTILSFLLIII